MLGRKILGIGFAGSILLGCVGMTHAENPQNFEIEKREHVAPDLNMRNMPAKGGEGFEANEPDWYMALDYAGFEFELPAGCVVDKNSSLVAKYPDGSFGVSMSNVEKRGSNQKIAKEVCNMTAQAFKLPNAKVKEIEVGSGLAKSKGAMTSGKLEGQDITILVLPYNGQELTTVVLATPNRLGWVNHFIDSLKR